MPAWYPALRAADRLGIPFPELLARPDHHVLIELVLGAEAAETHAVEMKRKSKF